MGVLILKRILILKLLEMITRKEIFETLVEMIADCVVELKVFPAEITENMRLKNDLGADSMDIAELAMECERRYRIVIKDPEFEQATTVGKLTDLIADRINNIGYGK